MNSESDSHHNEIKLEGTAQDSAKLIQISKIEAQTLNLSLTEEQLEIVKHLDNPSPTGLGGIIKAGNPHKSLDYWQGRREEIARISEWLADENIHLIGIEGVGGIGKSTLAAKIYEEEIPPTPLQKGGKGWFPKRFWADVGTGGDFSSLARQILAEFGYPVPEQEAQLQDVLIRRLQSDRHLIIIDNLESLFNKDGTWNSLFYEQFFKAWLEQGDRSTILVTTREKPNLRGFNHWIELKGLKPPEGAELLSQLKIEGNLEDFSRGVDGHPLLLRLIADLLLAEFPQDPSLERLADLGLGNLQQLLTDERVVGVHRKETVGMALVLDASFNRLSNRQQELFLYTSVYRGEFDRVAAAAVVNFPDEEKGEKIEGELRELRRRSLLEDDLRGKERFFRFQPLVLEYARYKVGDLTQLHQKAIAYYVSIAKTESWETLEDVKPYLEIFYHRYQLGEYDTAFDALRQIDNFLTLRGYYQVRVDYYSQLVAAYEQQGDPNNWNYAASLTDLGNAYNLLGQYQEAIAFHQQSLAIFREIGDRNGEARSYGNLGNAYDSLGQYQEAISFHQQSLAICREIGDRRGEADTWFNLGDTFSKLKRKSEARDAYLHARELYQAMGLDADVQNCDRQIQQIQRKKFPLIVVSLLRAIEFLFLLVKRILADLLRLLRRRVRWR